VTCPIACAPPDASAICCRNSLFLLRFSAFVKWAALHLSRNGVSLFRLTPNHRSSEVVSLLMSPLVGEC